MTPSATGQVFAVQCPNAQCRKFLLVEERDRGQTVTCLICKQPFRVAADAGPREPMRK